MFKSAYTRGVQNALISSGRISFPDGASAVKIAAYIADHVAFEPLDGQVPPAATLKIATALIDASDWYRSQPGYKAASFYKVASMADLNKMAEFHAVDLMEKAAEGSTIEGGDKGNKEPTTGEGKMDLKERPEGYATDMLAKTDVDTKPGAVGKEEEHPNKPERSPSGDNSIKEQSRTASLQQMIQKMAEGSTILGGDKGNTEPTTAEGKMDMQHRPAGYAVFPGGQQGDLGEMMKLVGGPAVIGKEILNHPSGPSRSPSGTNSLIEHSQKAAAEDPFVAVFKKTAAEILPYLAPSLSENAKVAHIRACMGLTTEEKAHYIHGLTKTAADKTTPHLPPGARGDDYNRHNADATHSRPGAYDGRTANQGSSKHAELPPFIQEKIDAKKNEGGEEKKDEKTVEKDEHKVDKDEHKEEKDEKKEEKDEKMASLNDHLRRIQAAMRTGG